MNFEYTFIDDVTNCPTVFRAHADQMNAAVALSAVSGRWGGTISGVPATRFTVEVFHETDKQYLFIFNTTEKAQVACKIVGFVKEVQ